MKYDYDTLNNLRVLVKEKLRISNTIILFNNFLIDTFYYKLKIIKS